MTLESLLQDKSIKTAAKTDQMVRWLLDTSLPMEEFLAVAQSLKKETDQATCMEALEHASRQNTALASEQALDFATRCLCAKAPRLKWESARVIGNIAHLFPEKLEPAIKHLLANTNHEGTVVRWSAATALREILKLRLPFNTRLLPEIASLSTQEQKNSIRKIYLDALKTLAYKSPKNGANTDPRDD